jgi:hypothetical protein
MWQKHHVHCPLYRLRGTLSLGGFCRWRGPKSGSSMVAVTISNRGYVKRDPPEHGFGLWPGSGKVAGKVLKLDLNAGHTKLLITLNSVTEWL